MKISLAPLLTLLTLTTAQTINSTIPANQKFNFGKHYAVLNLDLIDGIVSSIATTSAGQAFINSTSKWIDAVHNQNPKPLIIFTRIYFTTAQRPEIGPETPIAPVVAPFGNITETSPISQIYSAFNVLDTDVVLQKTRYYAGAGNGLEEILKAQEIDTVILVSYMHTAHLNRKFGEQGGRNIRNTNMNYTLVWNSNFWRHHEHCLPAF